MAEKEPTTENKTNKEEKNQEEPKKPSKKLLIIIIISSIVLVMLIATVVTAVILTKRSEKIEVQTKEMLYLVPMREFLVNLIDYGGRRFLKATIELEVDNPAVMAEITTKETILRNYIINILSSKTFNDVKDIEGKTALRKDIISKSNLILKTGKVLNVYFNEFIIQ
ncbi:MAG: flagellar basal body-associated FliL family protein [Candidatus Margulisbacteria bacterium]|nr:flagellar basal body-associated FliL family protein [Candidatus Margulisiibacteriota bacterium]